MARLRNTKSKSLEVYRNGAYFRCFGDVLLSRLLSRVQGLIIKNGNELEKLVTELLSDKLIDNVDAFLSAQIMDLGVRVATKKAVRDCTSLEGKGIEPDFVVFVRRPQSQHCYIVELKDGHEFDTKSSEKELENLVNFLKANEATLHYYNCSGKIVAFNAGSREEIREGFKRKIDVDDAMTGREFCQLVGMDYDSLVAQRAADLEANLKYFVEELLQIPAVKRELAKKLNS